MFIYKIFLHEIIFFLQIILVFSISIFTRLISKLTFIISIISSLISKLTHLISILARFNSAITKFISAMTWFNSKTSHLISGFPCIISKTSNPISEFPNSISKTAGSISTLNLQHSSFPVQDSIFIQTFFLSLSFQHPVSRIPFLHHSLFPTHNYYFSTIETFQ